MNPFLRIGSAIPVLSHDGNIGGPTFLLEVLHFLLRICHRMARLESSYYTRTP